MGDEKVKEGESNKTPLQKTFIAIFENPIFAFCLYAVIIANSVVVILEIMDYNEQASAQPCVCGVLFGANSMSRTAAGDVYYVLNLVFNIIFIVEMFVKFFAYGFFGYWKIPLNCFDGALVFLIFVEFIIVQSSSANTSDFAENEQLGVGVARVFRLLKFVRFIRAMRLLRLFQFMRILSPEAAKSKATSSVVPDEGKAAPPEGKEGIEMEAAKEGKGGGEDGGEGGGEGDDDDDDDDDGPFDPMDIPDSALGKFLGSSGCRSRWPST